MHKNKCEIKTSLKLIKSKKIFFFNIAIVAIKTKLIN